MHARPSLLGQGDKIIPCFSVGFPKNTLMKMMKNKRKTTRSAVDHNHDGVRSEKRQYLQHREAQITEH